MIDERPPDAPIAPRKFQLTAKGVIATVAALAALGWAFVAIRDTREVNALARKLRNGDTEDRQIAARELRYHAKTPEDLDVSVSALVRLARRPIARRFM